MHHDFRVVLQAGQVVHRVDVLSVEAPVTIPELQ